MTQGELFENLPKHPAAEQLFGQLRVPVWTANKARLIANYLRYFVFITKHGAYIDGFAGPKKIDLANSWAAELVINSEPKFLREFFLCDLKSQKIDSLKRLVASQPAKPPRKFEIFEGDFNNAVTAILSSGHIKESTATFCLIDQFTAQCHWATLEALARHKEGNKIELFYFFATGWMDRALRAFSRNVDIPRRWWGRDDWSSLIGMNPRRRIDLLCDRFRQELGYRYVTPWPIFKDGGGGRVMFHMIHATDHDEAPKLMWRAYRNATNAPEPAEQLALELSPLQSLADSFSGG